MGTTCRQVHSNAAAGSPQQKMEQMQQESSEKLQDALDGVEDNLDAKVQNSLSDSSRLISAVLEG